MHLVETRQHDPEPGPAALAPGHQQPVGVADVLELLAPAQPAVHLYPARARQEEQQAYDEVTDDGIKHEGSWQGFGRRA